MKDTCEHCGAPTLESGVCPHCAVGGALNVSEPAATGIPALKAGTSFGAYDIIESIGSGGMGVVYKARQRELGRTVALKVLASSMTGDADFLERFRREAKALAALSHPNIVAVYDFGVVGGSPYLAMEFVEGVTLRRLLAERRLPPEEALSIVPQLCDALEYAHTQGVVHRDIKPENILIDRQGRVKIADFGIAKVVGGEATRLQTLTHGSVVLGTPHYMAPEQLENPARVDHRADIYSMGVVFYEMLTGELPIGRFAAPSKKAAVNSRLDEIVFRALEKEPDDRYQRASHVKTALLSVDETPRERVVSAPAVPVRKSRSALWGCALAGLGLVLLLVCGGGAFFLLFTGVRVRRSQEVPRGVIRSSAEEKPYYGSTLMQQELTLDEMWPDEPGALPRGMRLSSEGIRLGLCDMLELREGPLFSRTREGIIAFSGILVIGLERTVAKRGRVEHGPYDGRTFQLDAGRGVLILLAPKEMDAAMFDAVIDHLRAWLMTKR